MKTIKFVAQDQNQKDFAKELTKRIRGYFKEKKISTYGDYRMLLKAILMIGIYIAALVVIFTVDMPAWFALILMVIVGIGEAGIGMGVMHDAAHGSFSKRKWLNTLMTNTILLLGSNVINWKIQHNVLHHTYPNVNEWDSDIGTSALRLSSHQNKQKKYRKQHWYGMFLYGWMTILRFALDFKDLKEYDNMGALELYKIKYKRAFRSMTFTKLLYLGVFFAMPFIFTDFSWWQIFIGFIVMHYVASLIMSTVFQLAHIVEDVEEPLPDEDGVIKNEYFVHQLQTTSNFGKRNGLFSWYIGGLNFQVEHHLFPHICHVHYPKISKIVRQTAKEFDQPYHQQKSALSALRSHFKTMKQLGKIPEAELALMD
jgi:linoleoyl-CoA desaturase